MAGTKPDYFRVELCGKCVFCHCKLTVYGIKNPGYCAALEKRIVFVSLWDAVTMGLDIVCSCEMRMVSIEDQ